MIYLLKVNKKSFNSISITFLYICFYVHHIIIHHPNALGINPGVVTLVLHYSVQFIL